MALPQPSGCDLLDALNPEQRQAVEQTEGPLLVLAGAGTGKTRVLTTRLVHIWRQGKAYPSQTLTVTFTNKAAREMRERASALSGPDAEPMRWLGTFHAIAARMLRTHAELAGLASSSFTILNKDDQIRLLKQVAESLGLDPKRWPPRYLAALIDGWKNRALSVDRLPLEESGRVADGHGQRLYQRYQERLTGLNAVDFGDLTMRTIELLQSQPDVLADYHRRFRYILVDEYQDTNVAQYLWLRLLAQGSGNICCVGDDDQSIYGWRGAEVDNILRFERDFPGAQIIRLERNYRSTGHILAAASHLIAKNRARLGKTLRCEAGDGEPVTVSGFWDDGTEARTVAERIEDWHRTERRYDECAILVRTSAQMRAFEECFIMQAIPYRVLGGLRFYDRAEIRDILAYLRLIRSKSDDLAFERIINLPRRGIGLSSLRKIHQTARENAHPLIVAAEFMLTSGALSGRIGSSLRVFLTDLERWTNAAASLPLPRLTETVLEESGYADMLRAEQSLQSQTRHDNLHELVRVMSEFDSLAAFLEHVELVMDISGETADEDRVQILTLHSAKGLEWPCVFLPGWEEDLFPSRRSLDESGARGLEEERRLAHVGITRAREHAFISFVANRRLHGRYMSVLPSRFIDELPAANVLACSETGYRRPDRDVTTARHTPGQTSAQQHGAVRNGSSSYAAGQKIAHDRFGTGRVLDVDGNRLHIDFGPYGRKKIIDRFVRPL